MAFGKVILFVLNFVTLGLSYCPRDKIYNIGHCAFRIQCFGAIRGVSLPDECQGSTNYPVTIDLMLTDAIERFDTNINTDFLNSITTLRVSAVWPQTSLSFLEYMHRLKHLHLTGNQIQFISGSPFYHLSELETIDLSYNNLTEINDLLLFESQPNNLLKLYLANNVIKDIAEDVFSELTSLVELDLSHNLITNLNEEPFSNLTKLEILKLNNNKIVDLNGAVNNLKNLNHLYLRGNQIQNIDDESLNIIYHLETFDVSGNQLDQLKPIVFSRHWKHIEGQCRMILSENQITYLPNATYKEITERYVRETPEHSVEVLTEVDLSKNSLTDIEYNAFQAIYQLTSLDLSCNRLSLFNVNPKDLVHLQSLNLSSNLLSYLYFENFLSMNNLQNLDLSHNKLYFIPDRVFINNYNLKHVNMSYNDLREVNQLNINMFHPDGGILDLSNNDLALLRIPFGDGLRLNMLLLNSNNVTDMAYINLYYQNELRSLEIRRNCIQELEENTLLLPTSLMHLDLSDNYIHKIHPSTFQRISNLRTLRLGHNDLETVDFGMFKGLDSLINLDLSFNKIKFLDSKTMMDLKSLRVLSIRSNGMNYLNYDSWFGREIELKVYVDDNNFSCDWLAAALKGFNNGYSKMKLETLTSMAFGNSLGGIRCTPKQVEELIKPSVADERLLITNQKILEAIKEQTEFLKTHFWQSSIYKTISQKAYHKH